MAVDKQLKQKLKNALTKLTSAMMAEQNACVGIDSILTACLDMDAKGITGEILNAAGGEPLLKEPLESVKNAIENIYKNDNKKSKKLTDEFNKFLNAQFEDYESICSGIIKEINKDKKHLVGVQAGIVRWCKNVIKEIKAGKKKAEKAASNPMAFAENLGKNFLNGLF